MSYRFLVVAGFALSVASMAQAADKRPPDEAVMPAPELVAARSEAMTRVTNWVAASKDNSKLPYIIIDKLSATMVLFDASGKELATAPVLLGIAFGDDATPGVGSKNLSEIGPAEKTTPAGRYLAKFGVAAGKQRVLWVDYANSVALHPIPPVTKANRKDHRKDRMLSVTPNDNRITYGCINVPKVAHARIATLFQKKGGYVYVLPDAKPLEDVFPPLHAQPYLSR